MQVIRTAKPQEVDKDFKNAKGQTINVYNNNGDSRVKAGNAVENQVIPFTNATDVVNGKKAENVKENTVARKYLAVNGDVDVNTYGGINMDTGEKYTDKDVISGKVIGMGQLPILKKTGGFVKDRHVKQLESSKGLDWKDYFIVSVTDRNGNATRVAVPLSQYPLADAWSEKYKELGITSQIQGSNIDASKGNTARLDNVQTPLKVKEKKKTTTEAKGKSGIVWGGKK